jgi:hypothetical protein
MTSNPLLWTNPRSASILAPNVNPKLPFRFNDVHPDGWHDDARERIGAGCQVPGLIDPD